VAININIAKLPVPSLFW